ACSLNAWRPITLLSVIDANVRDCVFRQANDAVTEAGIAQKASIGVFAHANNGVIENCDFAGYYKAIGIQQFCSVRDSRIEMCDRGIVVGENETGDLVGGGAIMDGMEMEANNIHIHLPYSGNTSIRSVGILGDPFTGIIENPRRPGLAGLLVQRATRLHVQNLDVSGQFQDAGIKFERTEAP